MRYLWIPLIIGWFLGAASGLLFMHYAHQPGMHGMRPHRMRDQLFSAIKATPEQRVKIDAIVQSSREKIQAIFAQTQPRITAIRQASRNEIRALLNPEQQKTFDQLDAKMEEKFKKRIERMHEKWQ